MNVLVTGANGFLGRALCEALVSRGRTVRAVVRHAARAGGVRGDVVSVGSDFREVKWSSLMAGMDAVIHLAARVHVMAETAVDPLAEFRAVNVDATATLARAAAASAVKRFVFVSSIKVNGENTAIDRPYAPTDVPQPQDPYGVSKWEAERALGSILAHTSLQVCVVRPPLVYGPGVGGNFLRLLKLVHSRIPLPLGSIINKRSMVYVANLASALCECAAHPAAAGRTFLVSDGEDLSTPELVARLSEHLNVPRRLLNVPPRLLEAVAAMTGKRAELERLTGSLVVDASDLRQTLGWQAPHSVSEGLRETACWFRQGQTTPHV